MRSSQKSNRNRNKNRPKSLGNVTNRVFESNGPEGKVRGTPQQIIDKYEQLARDSQTAGDRVTAENFHQHAEHYARLLSEAQAEMQAHQERQQQQQAQQQQGGGGGGGNDRPEGRKDGGDSSEGRGGDRARGGEDPRDSGAGGGLETIDPVDERGEDALVKTPEAGAPPAADDGEAASAGAEGEGAAKPGRSTRRRRSRTRDRQDGGEGEGGGGEPQQPAASEAASG